MTGWWAPSLVGGGLLAAYAVGLVLRPRTLPGWKPWRTAAWGCGAVLVAVALSPPLADLAHHDHRYHMAQHLLLGMYAPLGLVLGAPVTLALGSLPRRNGRRLVRVLHSRPAGVLSHPVGAALLNVGGMFVLYLTPLYELSNASASVRWAVLAHFLLAGCLYTWSIAGPDPAPRRPGLPTRTAVLVLAAGAHAFLAKYLYAHPPGAAAAHDHASTWEAAALWMYYGGDVAEVALAVLLFAWAWRRSARLDTGLRSPGITPNLARPPRN